MAVISIIMFEIRVFWIIVYYVVCPKSVIWRLKTFYEAPLKLYITYESKDCDNYLSNFYFADLDHGLFKSGESGLVE